MKRSAFAKSSIALLALGAVLTCGTVRAQDAAGDPSTEIVGKMQVAVGQLTKLDTGKPTQTTQKQIVDKLDSLIAQLEKECENCRGSRVNPNATKPAQDSTVRSGPGGSGDLHAARKEGKNWGELPAHERDRILQSMTEGFPPHYQRILERYYKRLAQETPGTDAAEPNEKADATGKPATADKGAAGAKTSPVTATDAKPAAATPATDGGSNQ